MTNAVGTTNWSISDKGEQRFRELSDAAAHPIWTTDSCGFCTFLNKAWYRITGQAPHEGEGSGWLEAVHPDDREEVKTSFTKASELGTFYCVEYRLRISSGGYRWHLDVALPRFDSSSAFIGYVGNVIDIHDRKLTEKNIQLSNNRFSAAIEAVAGVVWFTDANGYITEEQPGWSALTGQTFEEYKGNGWANAIHPDDREYCFELWRSALEQKKPFEIEERVRLADGQWRLFFVRAVPVIDAEGNVLEWVGVDTDITERKAHEKHVEHLATHDALTGLPNRMLFEDRLNHLIRHRNTKQHAIFFIDLDQFKPINDTLGHQAGDQLLWRIGKRLVNVVRDGDTVARFGGDEFMVLIENIDSPADAIIPAEKILSVISEPIHLRGQDVVIHASIGICIYPQDGEDASRLIRRADVAMYEAKKIKGGGFRFYEHELDADSA
ncbi:MAG TPA: diguanylate cyclase [Methylophilaceae bacterium]|nr:diguanylate cyclase [Methylophilaceae bacterium]